MNTVHGLLDHTHSEQYVQSVMSYNPSPVVNIGANVPYGIQTPQTPQNQNQFSATYQSTPISPIQGALPVRAVQLMEDVKARKVLTDLAKKESDRGKKTKTVGSKLFVNNKLFKKYSSGHVVDSDQDD